MNHAIRPAVLGAVAIGRTPIDRIQCKPELAPAGQADPTAAGPGQAIACTLAP